jgi:hypothetical protein
MDVFDVHGSERTPHPDVSRAAGLQPRQVVTSEAMGRALRRLGELPIASTVRMTYQPIVPLDPKETSRGGLARVDVFMKERHVVPHDWLALATLAVAASTIGCLLLVGRLWPRAPAPVIAVGGAIAASFFLGLEAAGVSMVGAIPAGLPALSMPDRNLILGMWPAAAGIALMSFTESIAAARAFRRAGESRVDSNQELVAVGRLAAFARAFGAGPRGRQQRCGRQKPVSGIILAGSRSPRCCSWHR